MVDFKKMKSSKKAPTVINPVELFRRMPKPKGVNDLYSSQSEVLSNWFDRRTNKDTVIKLHTGGGKTMVGLLIAQSTINEIGGPFLYLTPTNQLVKQTLEKASEMGISAVPYRSGKSLDEEFINSNAIMVANYHSFFNGHSKFGIHGKPNIQQVSGIILDDAHASFPILRECFTLNISSTSNRELYLDICSLFRKAFIDIDKLGTFEDIVNGNENLVLEVPYWSWRENSDLVRTKLLALETSLGISWPLMRDNFHLCHAFINKNEFSISTVQPLINMFPTFIEASRRIYMSATIADDSDIVRTFDVSQEAIENSLSSRAVAGISERMILIPDLMNFEFNNLEDSSTLLKWVSENNCGSIVLAPSDKKAEKWDDYAQIVKGSVEVEKVVSSLQQRTSSGPFVFSNRYDGIDLPGDSCRLLVMDGLPMGTSSYELYRATALMGGEAMSRMMAQRIEQGLGRGARGSSDYCAIILVGSDLTSWIGKNSNFSFFTHATKAQIEMGISISEEVKNLHDLSKVIAQSLTRDGDWLDYYSEELADYLDRNQSKEADISFALTERKAINLWQDGYLDLAANKIVKFLEGKTNLNNKEKGWLEQLIARIYYYNENEEMSSEYQKQAYGNNRNLLRPQIKPIYKPMEIPSNQAIAIVENIGDYRNRRSLLKKLDQISGFLTPNSSSNQFEQALNDLGNILGFKSERFDEEGVGPDVLWLLDNSKGIIFEAKSRKKGTSIFRKEEHGQLLIAERWFNENYPELKSINVSVHPKNKATEAAQASNTYALTYDSLSKLVLELRAMLGKLVNTSLNYEGLIQECEKLLSDSNLNSNNIEFEYLKKFTSK
ncbi:DEAD/DEAH box helicase [Enterococcus casseliflavus]|uniref:DEAD/DEAH box helicase n=1 Tax=Enterococcus TaxID=1350 RepID=UPI001CBBE85A|nr:DEAD/DEAH box helicase [Enterococcus casseliflavus]MBZ3640558.1 DEAD/DEAH box helicase family protein [Enterococcus casseliflavus]